MRLVVDTNIVFSVLIKPKSHLAYSFFQLLNTFELIAPQLLLEELTRYDAKIKKYSGLTENELRLAKKSVLSNIVFYDLDQIPDEMIFNIEDIMFDIDVADRDFVALAISNECLLWTGDKKLMQGLKAKGYDIAISTDVLITMI